MKYYIITTIVLLVLYSVNANTFEYDDDYNDDYLFNYADDDAPFKDDDNIGDDENIGDDDLGAFEEFTDDFLHRRI